MPLFVCVSTCPFQDSFFPRKFFVDPILSTGTYNTPSSQIVVWNMSSFPLDLENSANKHEQSLKEDGNKPVNTSTSEAKIFDKDKLHRIENEKVVAENSQSDKETKHNVDKDKPGHTEEVLGQAKSSINPELIKSDMQTNLS
ncbi:hypothetical protein RFI_28872, partial [Reticulomyxa filosa]